MQEITCFKAYDVRGRVPDQLNEDIAYRIGRAYAEVIKPQQVVVGHDIRLTSEAIKAAVSRGLMEQGVDVYDIGLCGTEEIYFATSHAGMDGGIATSMGRGPLCLFLLAVSWRQSSHLQPEAEVRSIVLRPSSLWGVSWR